MKNLLFVFTIVLNICNVTLFADQLKLKDPVRITKMEIIGEPLKGSKVKLLIEFVSFINTEANLSLNFSNQIRPIDFVSQKNCIKEVKELDKNQLYTKEYELYIEDLGNSIVTFFVNTQKEVLGYNRSVSRYLGLDINEKESIVFDERSNNNRISPKIIYPIKEKREIGNLYTVSISGRIEYLHNSFLNEYKGLYGSTVELWFRNSSTPDNWYHPVYSPNCRGTRNVHYDIVDVDGNYQFNFNFNGNLSGYNQILVIVSRDNSASHMPVQQNGITTWCDNTYSVWFSLSESYIGNINGNNTSITINNANALVNSKDGAILRSMMFSRESIVSLYNNSVPFPLPNIYTLRTDIPDYAGIFHKDGGPGGAPWIEIDNDGTEISTVSHEYGHYVNYKLWNDFMIGTAGCSDENGNTIPNAGRTFREGWAVFYSFFARNYANKLYGDDLRIWDDNAEQAAYDSPRFINMRYNSLDPAIPAFACYLWDLFDNAANVNFESNMYVGDNDDIAGKSVYVFDVIRSQIMDCTSKYHIKFKTGLSTEEQGSVNDIYTFMLQNAAHNPHSAQVFNVNANVLNPNQIKFQWDSQSYSGTVYYGNYESGFHIYKRVNNDWQLIYTAGITARNYIYNSANGAYGDFKITSYNSQGDSYNGVILNIPVVAPVVSGLTQSPVPICKNNSGYVYANLSQGNGDLNYNWTATNFPEYVSITPQNNRCRIDNGILPFMKDVKSGDNIESLGRLTLTVSNQVGTSTKYILPSLTSYPCQPPSGCPFVYTWNGETWTEDNNILPQSRLPGNEGNDVTDYYQLYKAPALTTTGGNDETGTSTSGGRYRLLIGEYEQEQSQLDQFKLLLIDHAPDTYATIDDSGMVLQFYKPALLASAELDSTDVKKLVEAPDEDAAAVSAGDTLSLGFEDVTPNSSPYLYLIAHSVVAKDKTAGRIAGADKTTFSSFRLRVNPSYQWFAVPAGNASFMQVDILWDKDAEVDYTELSRSASMPFTLYTPALLSAEHSVQGPVLSALQYHDENYAELNPGEDIILEFEAPPLEEGMERSFVLMSRGRYETIQEENKQAKGNSSGVITEYKLYDNYPNPFNPTTTIKYSIPKDGLVTLEIYNLLGEKIATLINEHQAAGNHTYNFDGSQLASGIYLYKITAGSFTAVKKMALLK